MSCLDDTNTSECSHFDKHLPSAAGRVGNTLFADAVFGNNKTARPFDSNRPYLTVRAAIKAARQLQVSSPIRISVRPGQYYERRLFPRSNMSIEGSGRLVTQIYGTFDTQFVTDAAEMTVLELMIVSQNEPAIRGIGVGKSSFRRVKISANYTSGGDGQYSVLVSAGNHIVTDSEVELNSTGGSNIHLHHHLGSSLTLERNTNTLNISPLPQVEVTNKITKGGINYILTNNMELVLPYTDGSASILTAFQITKTGGTTSKIQHRYTTFTLLRGQTIQITPVLFDSDFSYNISLISDTGEVSNNRLQPALPPQAISVYNTLGATQVIVLPSESKELPPLTTSNIQVVLQGGSGILRLPPGRDNSDNYAYTFAGVPSNYHLVAPCKIVTTDGEKSTVVINNSLRTVNFNLGKYFANTASAVVDAVAIQSPTSSGITINVGINESIILPPLTQSATINLQGGSGILTLSQVPIQLTTAIFQFMGPGVNTYTIIAPSGLLINGTSHTSFGPVGQLSSIGIDETPNYVGTLTNPLAADAQLRTLNNRSAITSTIPITDVDNTRVTQQSLTSVPAINNVGETHNLTQPGFQLLAGQTPAITGNGIKAFQLQGKVNFTIGPSVVLAVRLLVPQNSVGSTALVFAPDIFAVSDQGNERAFTFPQAGVYTIDNALDEHVWIVQFFGNDTNLLHIFANANGSGPKAAMNNGTLETGNTVQGLIKSNSTSAQIHVNTLTAFDTNYIPVIDVPREARKLTAVQQISTAREHLRGGSQIEEQVIVPANTQYIAPPNTRDLILGGGDTIFLPALISISTGTIIGIMNGPGVSQNSTIIGEAFVLDGMVVSQVIFPASVTKQWLFTAAIINNTQKVWLVSNPIS